MAGPTSGRTDSRRRPTRPDDTVADGNKRSGRPVSASKPRRGSAGAADAGSPKQEYRAPALGPFKDKLSKPAMVASTPSVRREKQKDRERDERAAQRDQDRLRHEKRREAHEQRKAAVPVSRPKSPGNASDRGGSRSRSPHQPRERHKPKEADTGKGKEASGSWGVGAMAAGLGSYMRKPQAEEAPASTSPASKDTATPAQSPRAQEPALATDSEADEMVSAASEAESEDEEAVSAIDDTEATTPEPDPAVEANPVKPKKVNRARFADEVEHVDDSRERPSGRRGSDVSNSDRPRRSVDFDMDGSGRRSGEHDRRRSLDEGRRGSGEGGRPGRASADRGERAEVIEKPRGSGQGQDKHHKRRNPRDAAMGAGNKPRRYNMTGASNMLLLMEDKTYHPSCFSVYSFNERLPYDSVYEFFETLASNYPKYLYRITNRGKLFRPAKWELCPEFDVGENIEEVELEDGRNGDEDFFRLMGRFIGRSYDYERPPWEAMLVHNMKLRDGAVSALAIKIHHCFSDGQGMIMSYHTTVQAISHHQDVSAIQRSFDSKAKPPPATKALKLLYPGTTIHAWHDGLRTFYNPSRKEFKYSDPKHARYPGRLYYHSKGMRLASIKMIRDAIKGVKGGNNISLNDVATALVTRAARRAAEKRAKRDGHRIKDRRFALLIPISIRPKGNWELENYSTGSLAWFDFRSEKECGFEQALLQAHKEMKIIKESKLHKYAFSSFNMFYKYPWTFAPNWPIAKSIYSRIFQQYHVASNVPGPPKKVAFGGIEAQSYQVLPPSSAGKATMAIGMISYADEFKIAVSCDAEEGLRDLPRQMCEAFEEVAEEWIAEAQNRLEKKTDGA